VVRAVFWVEVGEKLKSVVCIVRLVVGWNSRKKWFLRIRRLRHALLGRTFRDQRPDKGLGLGMDDLWHHDNI